MNSDLLIPLSIAAWMASCFAAIGARALREFSRHELQELCQRRQTPDRFSEILLHHEQAGLAAEIASAFLAAFAVACGGVGGWLELSADPSLAPWWRLAIVAIVCGTALIISNAILPWSIARVGAAPFVSRTWPIWRFVGQLCTPLAWCARVTDSVLHRLAGRLPDGSNDEAIEDEIRTIVSEGHREGLLEEDARDMIESVIDFGDTVVSQIMTPRTEVHMVHVSLPWDDVVEDFIDAGHTRVPVYDKNRDDIVGLLYSKDLLRELAKGPNHPHRPIQSLLRKPLFVPEGKAVDDLLQLFQETRTHIALVLDEYGGVSGVVTIEDALEEIVGEIADEYDLEEEVEIHKISDDVCEALGRAHVDAINAEMGFELPESADFDTIGGFVFAEFGRVPNIGESITWNDAVRVTVLEATRRRVNRVRLERVRQESLETV